jgi:hypothetical protein
MFFISSLQVQTADSAYFGVMYQRLIASQPFPPLNNKKGFPAKGGLIRLNHKRPQVHKNSFTM